MDERQWQEQPEELIDRVEVILNRMHKCFWPVEDIITLCQAIPGAKPKIYHELLKGKK